MSQKPRASQGHKVRFISQNMWPRQPDSTTITAFERRRRVAKPLQAGCPVRIVRQTPGCVSGTELQAAPVDVGAAQQGGEGREGQGAMRNVRMVRIAGIVGLLTTYMTSVARVAGH